MKKSIEMLDQIIEKARFDDLQYRKQMIKQHEASKSVGESWMIFHLLELRKLITKENNEKT
jgi:hypothetical protein